MADHSVELNVAGQKCRVVSSADEEELAILARMVEDKLARILPPGRPVTTQAMILAAVALANDVRTERQRADSIAATAKASLSAMLGRVEEVLGPSSQAPQVKPTHARTGPSKPARKSSGGAIAGGKPGGRSPDGESHAPTEVSRVDGRRRSDGESSERSDGE